MKKRKKSIMKKVIAGAITSTIIIQLAPISASANEEVNKNNMKNIELKNKKTDEVDSNTDLKENEEVIEKEKDIDSKDLENKKQVVEENKEGKDLDSVKKEENNASSIDPEVKNESKMKDSLRTSQNILDMLNLKIDTNKDYQFGEVLKININLKDNVDTSIPKGTKIKLNIPKEAIDYKKINYYPTNPAIDLASDEGNSSVTLVFNQDFLFRGDINISIVSNILNNPGKYNISAQLINDSGTINNIPLNGDILTVIPLAASIMGLFDPYWDGSNFTGKGTLENGSIGGLYLPDSNTIPLKATYNGSGNLGPYDNVTLNVKMDKGQTLVKDSVKIVNQTNGKDITKTMKITQNSDELIINTGKVQRDTVFEVLFTTKVDSFAKVYTTQFGAISNTGQKGGFSISSGFIQGYIGTIPKIIATNKSVLINTIKNHKEFLLSGVTANDLESGNLTDKITVDDSKVDWNKPGVYPVTYSVADSDGNTVSKTIELTIKSNDKPVISGVDDISIKEGTTFNPMTGVTATDTEDGNITKDIKVTGTVDTDKPGKYELTYTVTDTDGNTTTVKRIVTVNPKMVVINNPPVIKAEDKTIKVGDKFNPMTGVTATDKEDGNITKDIKVIEDTVNTSKVGTYKVVYEVTDSKGATATKTITVTVISNDKPVISGADNVSIKEGSPFNPMTGVTATDTEDGNITKDIKVTGTVDTDKPGKYELTYTVTDKDGNTTTVKRTVIVNMKWVDINNIPVINAEDKTIKVGDKFNPMTGVTAIDKEDGNITKDIKVIEDTVNTSKPGTYKVVYEVTDSKGAKTTKTITVTVRSNDKPVISGADNVSIKEGTTFNPMAGVTATDTEDGNITKDIKVTGTVDIDKPGKYELTYTVTDTDGNTTTVKRTVIVNMKWVDINNIPVIKAEDKTIKVGDKFNPMTGVTATDKEDGNTTKDIKVIEDTVNTSKPGTYKVVYEVTDSKGATATKTITVTVRSNDKPVISGADNVSIKEGTTFNPMTGVTATDTEDGNITKDIKVTGTVDTDKPGKYELTYTVTDTDGNTTTVKRIITVNPKIVVINSMPVIKAEDKTVKVGDKFNPMTGVTATDKEDGNITKDIKVIENTVDTSKPGTYKVVYEVTDSQGAKTTKAITVNVINENIENSTINNNSSSGTKPSGNTNDIDGNNETTTKKPNNLQQNNQVVSNNNLNPQTGDIGAIGYLGLAVAALAGLFINKKNK
uniref:Cadherin domain-containing protein n=2 Tax=Paraclostridium sordellii TaxID=1505 RepID=A0A2I6SVY5_PARSO|nr:immunoglobulin-like domain-containing protein [Paeniclostridium sordellii]AUO31689.1 hypothetical protein [Paeniclostridium sordellii]